MSELASATHASYVAPSSAQGVGHARSLLLPLLFYVFRCAECELRQLPAAPDELSSADPSSELSHLLRFRLETLNRSRYTCFNSPSPSNVRSISTPSAYQSLLRLPSMGLKISHRPPGSLLVLDLTVIRPRNGCHVLALSHIAFALLIIIAEFQNNGFDTNNLSQSSYRTCVLHKTYPPGCIDTVGPYMRSQIKQKTGPIVI